MRHRDRGDDSLFNVFSASVRRVLPVLRGTLVFDRLILQLLPQLLDIGFYVRLRAEVPTGRRSVFTRRQQSVLHDR